MISLFIDKVRQAIVKYNMLQKYDKVLVGLSGGPDSVALLHALYTLKKEYSLDIYVAHLDHKFRGDESRADRKFCEDLARKLGLEAISEEIDVERIADEKKISLEEAARFVRYDFFKRVARDKAVKKIAVGHNKDDQAETVLMRLVRGAGTLGLGGMSPLKEMEGFIIIRPLIEVSRKQIEEFIKKELLESRHDSSNDKLIFTRNKLRHELIPYLEKNFNTNIKNVLVNMAENLRAENEFLERFSKRKFKSMSKLKNGEVLIDLKKFNKFPEALKKRILRTALEEAKGDLRRFTYQHWKEMDELIKARPTNSVVDLPGAINIVKHKNSLIIQKKVI